MNALIAACPGCGTQFRVTAAHLAPAQGLVRCGACLTVFRAEEMRVEAAAESSVEGSSAAEWDRERRHWRRHSSVLARELEDAPAPRLRARYAAFTELPKGAQPTPLRLEEITLPAEAECVEAAIARQRRPRGHRSRGRWLAAVALLVLVAAAEVLWLRFDTLAKAPTTRPLALRFCEIVGCTLPARRDVGAIRSRSLIVRSHPLRADGLRVDAVLVNQAPWPQAFPDVELRFSDITGRLIAARSFVPSEYLADELAGERTMPVAAPVQISFELIDPGRAAINYEMRFY